MIQGSIQLFKVTVYLTVTEATVSYPHMHGTVRQLKYVVTEGVFNFKR